MYSRHDVAADCRAAWSRFRSDAEAIHANFVAGLEWPEEIQKNKLERLLSDNVDSAFGRKFEFASIRSFEEYAERVPVASWQDIQPWVERVCNTNDRILTAERPLFLERTSGSSAAEKLIPYTPGLLHEFQQALIVWFASLYDDCPAIADGRSYWAMSPPNQSSATTSSGIRIGSAGDADYLANSCAMQLLPSVFGPSRELLNDDKWRLEMLVELLEASDLSMVSVWSPTFLSALLRPLTEPAYTEKLVRRLSNPARGRVKQAMASGSYDGLWPSLQLISCWMDGPSTNLAAKLAAQFSNCEFSPKGLLATEGVISFSWGRSGLCPLAIQSHVLEFIDEQEKRYLAHELVRGERYRPLISTAGGLYRYDLGDWIEVTDFLQRTPCIRFVGRGDTRSDLVGEKLDEAIAANALQAITNGESAAFLVPVADAESPHYRLVIEYDANAGKEAIAANTEAALADVYHYAQARKLRQLAPLDVVATNNIGALLQTAWEMTGRRAGDAKASHLIASPELARAIIALTNK